MIPKLSDLCKELNEDLHMTNVDYVFSMLKQKGVTTVSVNPDEKRIIERFFSANLQENMKHYMRTGEDLEVPFFMGVSIILES